MSKWRIMDLFRGPDPTIATPIRILFWGLLACSLCVATLGGLILERNNHYSVELSRLSQYQLAVERAEGFLHLVTADLYSLHILKNRDSISRKVDSLLVHAHEFEKSIQQLATLADGSDPFLKVEDKLDDFILTIRKMASRARLNNSIETHELSERDIRLLQLDSLRSAFVDTKSMSSMRTKQVKITAAETRYTGFVLVAVSFFGMIYAIIFSIYIDTRIILPIKQIIDSFASINLSRAIVHFPHSERNDELGALVCHAFRLQSALHENRELKKKLIREERLRAKIQEDGIASKKQFDALIDSLKQGVLVADSASKVVFINKAYRTLYRLPGFEFKDALTLDDILQHHIQRGVLPPGEGLHDEAAIERITSGKPSAHQVRLTDGRLIRVRESQLAGGGWISVHEDFTEQDRLRRYLEGTERLLVTIMENVDEAILARDAINRKFTFINSAAEILLGVDRSKVIGRTPSDCLGISASECIENDNISLREMNSADVYNNYTIETPGNGRRSISVSHLRVLASKRQPAYLLSVIRDITPPHGVAERSQAPMNLA